MPACPTHCTILEERSLPVAGLQVCNSLRVYSGTASHWVVLCVSCVNASTYLATNSLNRHIGLHSFHISSWHHMAIYQCSQSSLAICCTWDKRHSHHSNSLFTTPTQTRQDCLDLSVSVLWKQLQALVDYQPADNRHLTMGQLLADCRLIPQKKLILLSYLSYCSCRQFCLVSTQFRWGLYRLDPVSNFQVFSNP